MRALEALERDGHYVALLGDVPTPAPGSGEVLLRVAASGVNRADLLQIAGHYPAPPGEPPGLGLEAAGTLPSGARVCALLAGGGHAEWVALPEGQVIPLPAGVDFVAGAAIAEAFLTAYLNLVVEGALEAGQTVLVHAGGSGVGLAAIQVAKYLGARVAATTRTPAKVGALEAAGADLALASDGGQFATAIASKWGRDAVHVVLDPVGHATVPGDLTVLAPRGQIVVLAAMSGAAAALDLGLLLRKRAQLRGSTLRSRAREEKAALVARFRRDLGPAFESGRLRPNVDSVFPAARAAEAFERMRANLNVGKLVLDWTGAALLACALPVVGGRTLGPRVPGFEPSHQTELRGTPGPIARAPGREPFGFRAAPAESLLPGMPPPLDPQNIYAGAGRDHLAPAAEHALPRVYVPNSGAGTVSVIDPASYTVVRTFATGAVPQHVVPAYDLGTLWVANQGGNSLTAIDPATGEPGHTVAVEDPYNLYFTPDGRLAIVVAEGRGRLDFRDPHTFALEDSVRVSCRGVDHMDFTADGRFAVATCEFSGQLLKLDVAARRIVGYLALPSTPGGHAMPQDVRAAPDGRLFYVADMTADGVHLIDPTAFRRVGFVPTGLGPHGLYPSRDGTRLYVTNRGWHTASGGPHGPGSVSVIAVATQAVVATWAVPGGGSPDMGNVSADGRELWLSGRFDSEVYVFDTETGRLVHRIGVGRGPHGLTVWPQPGRYSLGHTGNMR